MASGERKGTGGAYMASGSWSNTGSSFTPINPSSSSSRGPNYQVPTNSSPFRQLSAGPFPLTSSRRKSEMLGAYRSEVVKSRPAFINIYHLKGMNAKGVLAKYFPKLTPRQEYVNGRVFGVDWESNTCNVFDAQGKALRNDMLCDDEALAMLRISLADLSEYVWIYPMGLAVDLGDWEQFYKADQDPNTARRPEQQPPPGITLNGSRARQGSLKDKEVLLMLFHNESMKHFWSALVDLRTGQTFIWNSLSYSRKIDLWVNGCTMDVISGILRKAGFSSDPILMKTPQTMQQGGWECGFYAIASLIVSVREGQANKNFSINWPDSKMWGGSDQVKALHKSPKTLHKHLISWFVQLASYELGVLSADENDCHLRYPPAPQVHSGQCINNLIPNNDHVTKDNLFEADRVITGASAAINPGWVPLVEEKGDWTVASRIPQTIIVQNMLNEKAREQSEKHDQDEAVKVEEQIRRTESRKLSSASSVRDPILSPIASSMRDPTLSPALPPLEDLEENAPRILYERDTEMMGEHVTPSTVYGFQGWGTLLAEIEKERDTLKAAQTVSREERMRRRNERR